MKSLQLKSLLDHYSKFYLSPLSMRDFLEFGSKACFETSFLFMTKELPARFANMCLEMSHLPTQLMRTNNIITLQNRYEQSFLGLVNFANAGLNEPGLLKKFNEFIFKMNSQHTNTVLTMAEGVVEYRDKCGLSYEIHNFLDRFYTSHIGIKMLINMHISLFGNKSNNGNIGYINPNCDIVQILTDAFDDARDLCFSTYGVTIELDMTCIDMECNQCSHMKIVYVPSHLYYIGFELFKNALRATVENQNTGKHEYPVLKLLVVEGIDEITIRISDRGGGIPHFKVKKIFSYMYSTAPNPTQNYNFDTPMAGYGHGLPLSSLYSKYLDGDLKFVSIDKYGTDVYVYLKRNPRKAIEILPVFRPKTRKNTDWTKAVHKPHAT